MSDSVFDITGQKVLVVGAGRGIGKGIALAFAEAGADVVLASRSSSEIDDVAAEGARFTRYYCSDSPCMPSRHGLMSGRFGINNGVVTHGGPASRLSIP